MKPNVGGADRAVRIVLGLVLIALNLTGVLTGVLAIAAWVIAAIALITALVRFCPANSLLGVNSCKTTS